MNLNTDVPSVEQLSLHLNIPRDGEARIAPWGVPLGIDSNRVPIYCTRGPVVCQRHVHEYNSPYDRITTIIRILKCVSRDASQLDAIEAAREFARESHRHPLFLEKRTYSTDPEHCPVQCLEVIMEWACKIPLAQALETEPLMDGDRICELVAKTGIISKFAVCVLALLSGSRDCCLRMAEPAANVPEGLLLRLLGIISTSAFSYRTETLREKSAEVVKNVTEALSV